MMQKRWYQKFTWYNPLVGMVLGAAWILLTPIGWDLVVGFNDNLRSDSIKAWNRGFKDGVSDVVPFWDITVAEDFSDSEVYLDDTGGDGVLTSIGSSYTFSVDSISESENYVLTYDDSAGEVYLDKISYSVSIDKLNEIVVTYDDVVGAIDYIYDSEFNKLYIPNDDGDYHFFGLDTVSTIDFDTVYGEWDFPETKIVRVKVVGANDN